MTADAASLLRRERQRVWVEAEQVYIERHLPEVTALFRELERDDFVVNSLAEHLGLTHPLPDL